MRLYKNNNNFVIIHDANFYFLNMFKSKLVIMNL